MEEGSEGMGLVANIGGVGGGHLIETRCRSIIPAHGGCSNDEGQEGPAVQEDESAAA